MTYKSFEEKNAHFSSSELIDDPEELARFRKEVTSKYIFRGVNEAKYQLFTSLQRHFLSGRINKIQYRDQFSFMNQELRTLKQSPLLPAYYKSIGAPISDYLYMSFLQHYEAPTTLMDFTEDVDVALFFASRNIKYPNIVRDNDIENFVSLYYIKSVARLPSILQLSINHCIENIARQIDELSMKSNIDRGDHRILELKDLIANILSFGFLKRTELGYIVGDNKSQYLRTYMEDPYYNDLYSKICNYLKTHSKTALSHWNNSIKFLFQKAIVIANLNQIAQKGCFIHYMPNKLDTPLEDYTNPKIDIYCVNIHKSLCPHIKSLIKCNQESLFPEPRAMARKCYEKSIQII